MLKDRRLRQPRMDHLVAQGAPAVRCSRCGDASVLNIEESRYSRLRRLLGPAFSSAAVKRVRPRMREDRPRVHRPLPPPTGACEFMSAFADRYPPQVMAEASSACPRRSTSKFADWGKAIATVLSYEDSPQRLAEIKEAGPGRPVRGGGPHRR